MKSHTPTTKTSKTSMKMFLALSLLAGGCVVDGGDDLGELSSASSSSAYLLPSGGTGQAREVMSGFDPLAITLYDADGVPLANADVTFTSPVSGATATFKLGGTVQTDDEGRAEIRPYASSIAGTYIVWAHADGANPMPFVLTNQAASPAVLELVTGTNQGTMLGMPFPYPLTVHVRDNYGNAVQGAPVEFAAPAAGPSTMLDRASVTSSHDGRATYHAMAGMNAGTYTVVAKVPGAPSVSFTLSNMSQPAFPAHVETLQGLQQGTTGSVERP